MYFLYTCVCVDLYMCWHTAYIFSCGCTALPQSVCIVPRAVLRIPATPVGASGMPVTVVSEEGATAAVGTQVMLGEGAELFLRPRLIDRWFSRSRVTTGLWCDVVMV